MNGDAELDHVLDLERQLLTPAVRRSRERVDALLHPGFFEFGRSGRHWTRQAMLDAIGDMFGEDDPPAVTGLAAVRLAATVVQVTYLADRDGRRTWRSSLWRKGDDGAWRVWFHQGTPC
ncbi:MAG TPA: DUF4440 domain-containing protein [Actinophytocola sp.]|jgi:hypothetical protein|nr:DUF4440 domain-containing protein [Actinophytocola sp.]